MSFKKGREKNNSTAILGKGKSNSEFAKAFNRDVRIVNQFTQKQPKKSQATKYATKQAKFCYQEEFT